MTQVDKCKALAQSMLGAELDSGECEILAAQMGVQSVGQGEILAGEGEPRSTLFLLAEGRMTVCRSIGDKLDDLYRMRIGECAGSRQFIDRSRRGTTLRADSDSTVLTLEPEDFERLIDSHPRLVYKVMRAIFRVTHANLMRMNLESSEMRNYMLKTGGRY